jgi:endonuclease/exonuclease/phosphatase family metal-dependent hydrolase
MEIARRRRVDVLSVQELTPILDAALRTEGREELLPHAVAKPRGDSAGTALYSRFPLEEIPPPEPTRQDPSAARLRLPSGSTIEVFSLHPPAPTSGAAVAAWRRELEDMPPARPSTRLRLLAGDFNATLDHPEFRALLATGYADAAERDGNGLRGTWPQGRIVPPPVVIDHVLVDDRCAVSDSDVIAMEGSDHLAVLAVLDLAPCSDRRSRRSPARHRTERPPTRRPPDDDPRERRTSAWAPLDRL